MATTSGLCYTYAPQLTYPPKVKEHFISQSSRAFKICIKICSLSHNKTHVYPSKSIFQVSEPNSKYEKITRKWFRQMWKPADLMKMVVSLCQKPCEEIRVAAYRVVRGLARQEWGQHYIRSRKGDSCLTFLLNLMVYTYYANFSIINQKFNSSFFINYNFLLRIIMNNICMAPAKNVAHAKFKNVQEIIFCLQ